MVLAMESGGGDKRPAKWYYGVLGLDDSASARAIRAAYKKLAMKWHPDKCNGPDGVKAKLKFQELQEAYAVLSDERKKMLYDNGLYSPEDDEDDIEGLSSFVSEISGMMTNSKTSEEARQGNSLEDLKDLFVSMFGADIAMFSDPRTPSVSVSVSTTDKKRCWGAGSNCVIGSNLSSSSSTSSSSETHLFFNDSFTNIDSNATKKSRYTTNSFSGSQSKRFGHGFNLQ